MRVPVAVLVLSLSFEVTCPAQQPNTANLGSPFRAESKAGIRHSNHGDVFVTENASFDCVPVLRDDGESYLRLLLLHTDRNEWIPSRDGVDGTVTAAVFSIGRDGTRRERWTVRTHGNAGRPLPGLRMFQISNWPCCSAPFENIYFSLLDGKRLYTTNGEPDKGRFGQDSALVRIDGAYDGTRYSQSRYVGFGAAANVRPIIPILQYGTDRAIKEQLSVLGHEYGDNFDVPEVSVTEDGKQFLSYLEVNGQFTFTIVLRFSEGPEIRIPVENDVIRPEKATLPPGYSLRARSNDRKSNR